MSFLTHQQLMAQKDQEIKWLINGLVKTESIGFIAGEPKTYKSWLALHIAQAVSTGGKFLGEFIVPKPGRVLLVQEEDQQGTVVQRSRLLRKGHSFAEPADGNLLFLIHSGLRVDDETKLNKFRSDLTDLQSKSQLPDLIIFDVLNKLHNGSDTDQAHATKVMNAFENIRRDFGCAVLIIHHFRKGASSRGNQRLRGSGVFAGWSENSLYCSKVKDGRIHVEVENKFAQTDNFNYKIISSKTAVCLSIAGPEKFALPPIEARIAMSKRERAKMIQDWERSHRK